MITYIKNIANCLNIKAGSQKYEDDTEQKEHLS